MKPGMRTSSFPGDVEDAIATLEFHAFGGSGILQFQSQPGYGGRNFAAYVNGALAARAFVSESQTGQAALVLPPAPGSVSICVEDLGDWADSSYDPAMGARAFEARTANRLGFAWTARTELFPRGTAAALAQLSDWQLDGVRRFGNCEPIQGCPARALLGVRLAVSGAQRTLSLWAAGVKVAEGSRTGGGLITLAPVNNSGLSGQAVAAAGSGIAAGEHVLEVRFPQRYEIHYSQTPLVFPRAPEQFADDDGSSSDFQARSSDLDPGEYCTAIRSVSDTGVASAASAPVLVTLPALPLPPGRPEAVSGGAAGTVIGWSASATPGATYNIYDSGLNGLLQTRTPAASTDACSFTLPACGYPGARRVLVRASVSGAEEQNAAILTIEYDAQGAVIGARPNAPRLRAVSVTAGRQIQASVFCFVPGKPPPPSVRCCFWRPRRRVWITRRRQPRRPSGRKPPESVWPPSPQQCRATASTNSPCAPQRRTALKTRIPPGSACTSPRRNLPRPASSRQRPAEVEEEPACLLQEFSPPTRPLI